MNCWPRMDGFGVRGVSMTTAEIRRYADADLLMRAAAEVFVRRFEAATTRRGHFTVALAGGSTPRALYRLLATETVSAAVDWSVVHVFWGDERCVPPDHDESNYRMARLALLDHVPIPLLNIHRPRAEDDPQQAAAAYDADLRAFFAARGGAGFDLVLLGMGDDGHTASLFPGTAALDEQSRLFVANQVPQLDTWRLTLTFPALNAADCALFLVTGAGKAAMLRSVLEGPDDYPAAQVDPAGELLWLVDAAAAAQLSEG